MKVLIKKIFLLVIFVGHGGLFINAQSPNPILMVTRTDDFNPWLWDSQNPDNPIYLGTLRWAINKANLVVGSDEIQFSSNLYNVNNSIILDSELPSIYGELYINGTANSLYSELATMVTIEGAIPGSNITSPNGLRPQFCFALFRANNTTIEGIRMKHFEEAAIYMYFSNDCLIKSCEMFDIGNANEQGIDVFSFYSSTNTYQNNKIGDVSDVYTSIGILLFQLPYQFGHFFYGTINNVIEQNVFSKSDVGVYLTRGRYIYSNRIKENLFYDHTTAVSTLNSVQFWVNGTANNAKPTPVINYAQTDGEIDGTAGSYDVIDLYEASANQNAEVFLGSTTTDNTGHWHFSNGTGITSSFVSVQARDKQNTNYPNLENSSELITVPVSSCPANVSCDVAYNVWDYYQLAPSCVNCPSSKGLAYYFIINAPVDNYTLALTGLGVNGSGALNTFSYSVSPIGSNGQCDPSLQKNHLITEIDVTSALYTLPNSGQYLLTLYNLNDCPDIEIGLSNDACESCIGSFAPIPGQKYLIGAWAKEEGALPTRTTYDFPSIYIRFTESVNGFVTYSTVGPFSPKGAIIDEWQRIEEMFTIPLNAIDMEIKLTSTSGNVLFDDIRVFPFNASMKTYVYDPINMRLAAELDERHYATFYEYDEEGKLIRIKKETQRGVMTIQETKSNSSK